MAAITLKELNLQSIIPIMDLLEFHLAVKRNSHGLLRIHAVVEEEIADSMMGMPMEQEKITVYAGDAPLFSGLIQNISISHEGRGYEITLTAATNSMQLDLKKKNRSFQDVNSTYEETMKLVQADTPKAFVKFSVENRKIIIPLYQLEETDWMFLKRLASHLNTSIYSYAAANGAAVSIGLPEGTQQEDTLGDIVCERIWFDKISNAICHDIATYQNWEIGDSILFKGAAKQIIAKSCHLEKGLLRFSYTIATKQACRTPRYENPTTAGILLSGTVLAVKEELVKVKLDIDKEQPLEKAYWYPWRPEVGNLMYCMPEKGEHIYLHLADPTGGQARAVCGVHKNGSGNPEMKKDFRYFTTKDNKRMLLIPDTIGFKDLKQKSPLEVTLQDESGTSFLSPKKIVISAAGTIGLKGNNISIQAPQEISIVRRDASNPTVINMCNGFDSVGATNQVTMSSGGEGGFPTFTEAKKEEGKEYSLEGVEDQILSSTPEASLMGSLEKKVRGSQVNRPVTTEAV